MIGMTMCSGIGAPELAAPWVDWRFASEIEPFPRAVLQERFGYRLPEDHNQGDPILWGDMTEIAPDLLRSRGIPLPDLVVAGTPCQAFSVAGLRKGTADARGNLTLKFVEIVHDLVAARPDGKLAVVWENVPGVLSDSGNAFGCFLGGLIGSDNALRPETGKSWPNIGMASGPKGRCAWRILDAQYTGVAQRRRRVFVVADFGNAIDPAAVLFDRKGLHGDTPPRRKAGQDPSTGGPTGFGGGSEQDVAATLETTCADYSRSDSFNIVTHALRGEGFDASEDGTGRGTPLVLVGAYSSSGDGCWREGLGPLRAREQDSHENVIALDCKGTEVLHSDDGTHPTLRSMGHNSSHQNAGGHAAIALPCDGSIDGTVPPLMARSSRGGAQTLSPGFQTDGHMIASPNPVAFDIRGRKGGSMPEGPHDTANIRAASGGSSRSYAAEPWAVRRLTPRECERLQGMPDDHTLIQSSKVKRSLKADEIAYLKEARPDLSEDEIRKLAADGPRYKAIGNSMAVPVMKWIIDRVKISHDFNRNGQRP